MHRSNILLLAFFVALFLGGGLAARADTRIEMKNHTGEMTAMGHTQPARDSESTLWVGKKGARRDDGETEILVRFDRNKLYLIDHQNKSYSALDLPVDLPSLVPEAQRQQMSQVLEMMKMNASVEPSDEHKEINGWDARKYEVHLSNQMGMKVDSTVWMTEAIDMDQDSFKKLVRAMASLQPGGGSSVDELLKLKGVPVLIETQVHAMGGATSSREELVSAEPDATPPAGTYDVPEGYTEKPFNPMGGGPPGAAPPPGH